jgi:hypothetical protein
MPETELVAVSVGNTRTRVGVFLGRDLNHSSAAINDDPDAIAEAITAAPVSNPRAPIVMASVNNPVARSRTRWRMTRRSGRTGC